ncbi:hypothetical protein [Cellulomonas biazotea]|jgi:hypothetical protein|uniref:Uncharacterized protein n=1 Tax=Cellulomonas biazotea TaxID=1709 RepID=A0A402DNY0_9CELL|nr:hypothetical protein [Cellulomonas biazotea]GCE75818.1 hypothetical protein CBZ_08740 [Cellulomonas biazotea]
MRTPLAPTVLAGCTVVVLLTACTSGGNAPSGNKTLTYEDSPLSVYFEQLGGQPDEAESQEQARRAEEVTAACMQEQGFEYRPQDVSAMFAEPADDGMPDWDSLEFAEQYGYGATTGEEMSQGQSAEEWVDPNADYVATMSEGEQQAYYAALYGEPQESTGEEEEVVEYDWTQAGCQGKAQHEVYEEGQVWGDPAYKDLMDELSEIYNTDTASDERLVAVGKAWSQCMADEGLDFEDPQAAQNSIYEAHGAIPFAEDGTQDAAAIAELKEKELTTAVADRTCQIETRYTQVQLEVQFDKEQEFIDAHKDELEAMVAKAADK